MPTAPSLPASFLAGVCSAGQVQGLPRLQLLPRLHLCQRRGPAHRGAVRLEGASRVDLWQQLLWARADGLQLALPGQAVRLAKHCLAKPFAWRAVPDLVGTASCCRRCCPRRRSAPARWLAALLLLPALAMLLLLAPPTTLPHCRGSTAAGVQVRQTAGLLLKNNIRTHFGGIAEDFRTFIKVRGSAMLVNGPSEYAYQQCSGCACSNSSMQQSSRWGCRASASLPTRLPVAVAVHGPRCAPASCCASSRLAGPPRHLTLLLHVLLSHRRRCCRCWAMLRGRCATPPAPAR